jgi:acetyl/propionyl-CoA carboxylase alpha subunit
MIVLTGGERHEVRVVERADGVARVEVDGRVHEIAVAPLSERTFRVEVDGRAEILHGVAAPDAVHVFWRGRAYVLSRETSTAATRAGAASGSHEAPMPGRVVAVKAAVGDSVVKGQPLLIIEAMKMENVVRAVRDGVVKRVAVDVGARVTPGETLVELQ